MSSEAFTLLPASAAAKQLEPSHMLPGVVADAPILSSPSDSTGEGDGFLPRDPDNIQSPPRLGTVMQQKIRDDQVFATFLKRSTTSQGDVENAQALGLNPKSTTYLMRMSMKIIDSPREYQLELYEKAKQQNTIIVLDTGCGKTLIAVMLIRHTIEEELVRMSLNKPKRIAFFLIEKVSLVHQQYHVIESNLPYPVTRIWGNSSKKAWGKAKWDQAIEDHMVVVCTAAILYRALASTYIRMDQINLMVFDEAHHAKKNHPYARIIKDFYVSEPLASRPRILGMTASPVDSKEDVRYAVEDLEHLLCSTIASVDKGSFEDDILNRDNRQNQVAYPTLPKIYHTQLTEKIAPFIMKSKEFRKLLNFAEISSSSLGSWCVDWFWKLRLSDAESIRLLARCQAGSQKVDGTTSSLVTNITSVIDLVHRHKLPPLEKSQEFLSSKVITLLNLLNEIFVKDNEHKCIVFVEMRDTAMVLADLMKQPAVKNPFIRSAPLFGCSSGTKGMSYSDQNIIIYRFRQGDLNCLFTTSVAEEGLDIPDCDTIIRFDLYQTMIQYVQSRGRARTANSKYYVMMEYGNKDHMKKVYHAHRDSVLLRQFCAQLPRDRIIESVNKTLENAAENQQAFYIIPSTGARLGWLQSLEVLYRFTAHLATEEDRQHNRTPQVEFMLVPAGGRYYCHVILPEASPIRSHSGQLQKSKADAKCSVAYELCIKLIEKGLIDGYLEPTFKKSLPIIRNDRLAISDKKKEIYKMRLKASFWLGGLPQASYSSLYGALIILTDDSVLEQPTKPLVLLTRRKFPILPDITLFFGRSMSTVAKIWPLEGVLSTANVPKLKVFTLRVFRDIFSKDFATEDQELPYMIAPSHLKHCADFGQLTLADVIDWEQVNLTSEHNYLTLGDHDPKEFYRDKFCIDPYDGGRKVYLMGVREDLHPLDPVPKGVPDPQYRGWRMMKHNIKEYSISMWGDSRIKKIWDNDQPVVEARQISLRQNLLCEMDDGDTDRPTDVSMFIIMEPMNISTLSPSIVSMCGTFPAIIHRVEETLIALEASQMLKLPVRPDLALAALTKNVETADDNNEYSQELRYKKGMGENYERLEFLGDAFLKMATTIALFTKIPLGNEFEYHVERMLLVCNINLFNTAVSLGLQEFIRTHKFNRRTWYPAGLQLQRGKVPRLLETHHLGDKSLADVCEAFIGAAYVSGCKDPDKPAENSSGFDMAVQAVTTMVNSSNHDYQTFDEDYQAYNLPTWAQAKPTAVESEFVLSISKITGYKFRICFLLRSAFKHPSYPWENIPNYQNLEFLGDALLDMCTIDFLYKSFPVADPQWLTEHKMAMVSNRFLGCLSVEIGFHKHLMAVDKVIMSAIIEYIRQLEGARGIAKLKAKETGVLKNYWASEALNPPKCLPDIVEAYIGALFVDSGYSYAEVYKFFTNKVKPYFENMALYDSFANQHPVTSLVKKLQVEFKCTKWSIMTKEQPLDILAGVCVLTDSQVVADVMIHGQVVGTGKSSGARYAKVRASLEAMNRSQLMSVDEFKEMFKCDCFEVKNEGRVDKKSAEV